MHCTCKLIVAANITRSSIILAAHSHALYKYFHEYKHTHTHKKRKKICASSQSEQILKPQRAHVIVIIVFMHITKHTLSILIGNIAKAHAKDINSIKNTIKKAAKSLC
uniref:Uncharacterized protein n=1 Tax=Bactrocera dorsalis TaxID=27457 RepID=A0A034WN42_BACDO